MKHSKKKKKKKRKKSFDQEEDDDKHETKKQLKMHTKQALNSYSETIHQKKSAISESQNKCKKNISSETSLSSDDSENGACYGPEIPPHHTNIQGRDRKEENTKR